MCTCQAVACGGVAAGCDGRAEAVGWLWPGHAGAAAAGREGLLAVAAEGLLSRTCIPSAAVAGRPPELTSAQVEWAPDGPCGKYGSRGQAASCLSWTGDLNADLRDAGAVVGRGKYLAYRAAWRPL